MSAPVVIAQQRRTVASLRPRPALVMEDSVTIKAAAKRMAEAKVDAVLLTDEQGTLSGILTDKDIMSRVVAEGASPETCLVNAAMTPDPSCVCPTDSALDALAAMVDGKFRHLPVVKHGADGSQVVGLLDITRCLKDAIAKLELAVSGDKSLARTIASIEKELGSAQHMGDEVDQASQSLLETLRAKIKSKTCGVLVEHNAAKGLPLVNADTSIVEATKVMKACHSSAVLVVGEDDEQPLTGIFTTKDLLLRVVAPGLDINSPISQVITRYPDSILPSVTVLEALEKMHAKRFLHLPVVSESHEVLGLVDVLQLSLAVVGSEHEEGTAWARQGMLALASMRDDDAGSVVSLGSRVSASVSVTARGPSSANHDSASVVSAASLPEKNDKRSVARLRPRKALVMRDSLTVLDAAKKMAEARVDATLLTNAQGVLTGILTDKDIMSRVVAPNLQPDSCLVSAVMTPNPSCVGPNDSALDALAIMVDGKFRHLPVVKNTGQGMQVVGLLDITKCLKDAIGKLESAASGDQSLVKTIESLEKELGQSENMGADVNLASQSLLASLRGRIKGRTCGRVVEQARAQGVPEIRMQAPVVEAAQLMKQCHTSAVLVLSEGGDGPLMGIFTTKDILMRVVAQGMSTDTRVVKVMTMFPDSVLPTCTVVSALELMHTKRFLHLPVVSDNGTVLGLVDVLQLTLDVINGGQAQNAQEGGAGEWRSMMEYSLRQDDDRSSVGSHSEIGESASVVRERMGSAVSVASQQSAGKPPAEFTYKVRTQGRVLRLTASASSAGSLRDAIAAKMRTSLSSLAQCTLSYVDDEGDCIAVEDDSDLRAAVALARDKKWTCVALTLSNLPGMPADGSAPPPPPLSAVSSAHTPSPSGPWEAAAQPEVEQPRHQQQQSPQQPLPRDSAPKRSQVPLTVANPMYVQGRSRTRVGASGSWWNNRLLVAGVSVVGAGALAAVVLFGGRGQSNSSQRASYRSPYMR